MCAYLLQVFTLRLELSDHCSHAALHRAQSGLKKKYNTRVIIFLSSDWLISRKSKLSSSYLIGYISKGEIGECHASVSPQSDAVVIAAQTEHLAVHL